MKINVFSSPKIITTLIIIFPLLFIWQGLDFSDTGYFLSIYQQIFNDPESVSGRNLSWLTNIIGGIWVSLFGDSLGLLGVNFAGVLTVYLSLWFSYLILKPYIDKRILLLGLFFTLIFAKWWYLLSYYNLSALFFIMSAFFITCGLKSSKYWQIALSGFIMGLNIFVRLPNIIGFLLIFVIMLFAILNKIKLKKQIMQLGSFIFGYIISILLAFFAIKIMGHYNIVIDNFKKIIPLLADAPGQHSFNSLTRIFYIEILKTITFAMITISSMLLVPKLLIRTKNRYVYYSLIILPIITISLLYAYVMWSGFCINKFLVFFVFSLLFTILVLYITNIEKSNNEFRMIAFTALLVLIFPTIGSSSGFFMSVNSMWLAFPIAFSYIWGLKELKIELNTKHYTNSSYSSFELAQKETSLIRKISIILIALLSLISAFIFTVRDFPNRFEMRYSIKNPRLMGIFTNKERARVVQELLNELENYVKEDDYLLAYEAISTLYFLTKTRPYLYSTQPLFYQQSQLRKYLDKAIKERPYFPVIVRAKGSVWDPKWPVKCDMIKSDDRNIGNRGILEEFIKTNGYYLKWENDFFEILLPKQKYQAQTN
ncbi:MAG: hypothetical protein ABIL44_11230 [candidate division WOR-3 bacterium]